MSDEAMLRPPERKMVPYEPKVIVLANGDKMLVRQVFRDEIPSLLKIVKPLTFIEKDFYDIVAARVYAELLGYLRYRVRDEFVLIGLVNGDPQGLVNSRLVNDDIGMSYHTMALKRGVRAGAHLFAAKMEYHFQLGNKEVLIVAESPIGFRRWMQELRLEPRFDMQHELGGPDSYTMTKKLYDDFIKPNKVFGSRPVSKEILEANKTIIVPSEEEMIRRVSG